MHHSELLGKSDSELLAIAPEATHQHFKGGLYRFLGRIRDSETGQYLIGKDGNPRECYLHIFPYFQEPWLRDNTEFFGNVESPAVASTTPRFRELKR